MEYNGVPLASMTTKQLSELAKSKGIGPKQSRAEFLNALADALLNEGEGEFGEDEPREDRLRDRLRNRRPTRRRASPRSSAPSPPRSAPAGGPGSPPSHLFVDLRTREGE